MVALCSLHTNAEKSNSQSLVQLCNISEKSEKKRMRWLVVLTLKNPWNVKMQEPDWVNCYTKGVFLYVSELW